MVDIKYVFVYGTLRRGQGNNGLMRETEGRFQYTGVIHGFKMRAISSHGFPFIRPAKLENEIVVEAYEYNNEMDLDRALFHLDGLEGYPRMYDRKIVSDVLGNRGWIYFDNGYFGKNYGVPVPSGDWKTFIQEEERYM